nr:WhiB family transcriptional regulator [Knoellia sp. DB2414S]
MAEAGRPVPCTGRPEWTSDRTEDAEFAAYHCRCCELIELCAAAAVELDAHGGVWGGAWRRLPTTRRRAS